MNLGKHVVFSLAVCGLLLAGLFLLLNGAPHIARAAPGDLFVTPGGSGDCSQASPCDLAAALGLASDGDTIYVAQGTYTGSGGAVVTITHSITLYGGWDGAASGPVVRDPDAHPTTLDGEGQRRVVYISGNISPTVDGFTITGGNASNAPTDAGWGGGIYGWGATPTIANNTITNNVAYTSTTNWGYGGGIYVSNTPSGAAITGNRVLSNVASTSYWGYGGGIYLEGAPSAQVVNNVVLSNTASITGGLGYGGGIALSGGSGAIVADNRVESNIAQGGPAASFGSEGGGIYCFGSDDATINGNVVRYNTASIPANGGGGGIGIWACARLTVVGNTLPNNVGSASTTTGGGRGGGLWAYASRDLVINSSCVTLPSR
jgi:nitrous oxidase accessory protein NosD